MHFAHVRMPVVLRCSIVLSPHRPKGWVGIGDASDFRCVESDRDRRLTSPGISTSVQQKRSATGDLATARPRERLNRTQLPWQPTCSPAFLPSYLFVKGDDNDCLRNVGIFLCHSTVYAIASVVANISVKFPEQCYSVARCASSINTILWYSRTLGLSWKRQTTEQHKNNLHRYAILQWFNPMTHNALKCILGASNIDL